MAKKKTVKPTFSTPPKNTPVPKNAPAFEWQPWALAILAFALYATGFSNPMVAMDDHTATIDNPAVRDLDLFGKFNLGMFAPLTWLIHGIAYRLNGGTDTATIYHVFSAIVHAVNVWLVFRLFRRWEAPVGMSAAVALIFAIHPLQTEAISWIAGFSTPLFTCFSIIALLQWTKWLKSEPRQSLSYWWALGAFVLACLSKSAAVMLPLSLLVLDIWWKRPLLKNIVEKIPFFLVSLAFGALTLVSRVHVDQVTSIENVYSLPERFLMACYSVLFYWGKLFLPVNLSIWYPFVKNDAGQLTAGYFAAPVVLAGILFLSWWKRKEWPLLWVGILYFLANIILALPFATMGTFELRADRYNYLAMLGIWAAIAALPYYLAQKNPQWKNFGWGIIAVLSGFFIATTSKRIHDWKDTLTLLNKSIERQGDNYGKAYLWRGMEYGDRAKSQKDLQRAIEDFSKAIEKNPELTEAYKYRGALYGMTRQFEKSADDLTVYLKANPKDAEYRFNRGLSYLNLNKPREALEDMNQTLKDNPNFYRAYLTRSNAWNMLGDTVKGQQDLQEYERMAQGIQK